MRLADRLAAAAEQSDLKQVGSSLAQVQQRLIHIMNYSVRGMLVHNTLTELAEDLRLAAAAEEPHTALAQLQKAADEFRQLSEYLSIKRPSPRPSATNSRLGSSAERDSELLGSSRLEAGSKPRASEGPSEARRREARELAHTPSLEEEGREAGRELMAREASARHQVASSEEAVSRSEGGKVEEPNLASSHEELQCKTTVAAAVLTGQGMLEAMRRAVRQSHSLHHSAACRRVDDASLYLICYDYSCYGYTCSCSLPHPRLQPPSPMVAASLTYGCRLVADTFLEVVDDLGSAAMSDEMAEVQRRVDRVNSRFFHVSDLIARNAMAAADNSDSAAAAAQSLHPAQSQSRHAPHLASHGHASHLPSGGSAAREHYPPDTNLTAEQQAEAAERRPAIDRRVALEQFGGDEGFFRRMCAKLPWLYLLWMYLLWLYLLTMA